MNNDHTSRPRDQQCCLMFPCGAPRPQEIQTTNNNQPTPSSSFSSLPIFFSIRVYCSTTASPSGWLGQTNGLSIRMLARTHDRRRRRHCCCCCLSIIVQWGIYHQVRLPSHPMPCLDVRSITFRPIRKRRSKRHDNQRRPPAGLSTPDPIATLIPIRSLQRLIPPTVSIACLTAHHKTPKTR